MTKKHDYHHGNLREALIDAGISLLDDVGWAGLSLRACAAKAGVSHAAPAHHFGNRAGLLTALAAEAFTRFSASMMQEREAADKDADAQLNAAGLGYVRFATTHPGLFQLMFGAATLNKNDLALDVAQNRAYEILGEIVAPYLSPTATPMDDHGLRLAVWSSIHGYSQLLLAGKLDIIGVSKDGSSHIPDLVRIVKGPRSGPVSDG